MSQSTKSVNVYRSPTCDMPEYSQYRRIHTAVTVDGYPLFSVENFFSDSKTNYLSNPEVYGFIRHPVIPYYDEKRTIYNKCQETRKNSGVESTNFRFDTKNGGIHVASISKNSLANRCRNKKWVIDSELKYRTKGIFIHELDSSATQFQNFTWLSDETSIIQAWWINGVASRYLSLDGFWVECEHEMDHEGLCYGLDITWDWSTMSLKPQHCELVDSVEITC